MSIQDNDDDMTTKENPEAPQEQEVPSLTSSDEGETWENAGHFYTFQSFQPFDPSDTAHDAPLFESEDETPEPQEQESPASVSSDEDETPEDYDSFYTFAPFQITNPSDTPRVIDLFEPKEDVPEDAPEDVARRQPFLCKKFAPKANNITVHSRYGDKDELFDVVTDIIEYTLDPKYEAHYNYPLNDTGISQLFADGYKWRLRFVTGPDQWYEYFHVHGVWAPCGNRIMEYCKDFVKRFKDYVDTIFNRVGMRIDSNVDLAAIVKIKSFANKLQSRRARETILKDAASVYSVSIKKFDRNPFILNCKNGVLNLETLEFAEDHRPKDWLTKMARVKYDPDAVSEQWIDHMHQVFQDDEALIEYVQKALGYALTGDTSFECFFILYGPTSRNGKGVTMGTFQHMLGDYACNTSPDTITQKKFANGSGPSEDIARLKGSRFVNISEPDQDMVLSSALVKTLTGNDVITARLLYKNSIEFKPICKFFINTNHRPIIKDKTVFDSDRIKVIPFKRHFDEKDRKLGLKRELTSSENLSGILNWCLEGLQKLGKKNLAIENFAEPEAVKEAIEEYRQFCFGKSEQQGSDDISQFIAESLEESLGNEISTKIAYALYRAWCVENKREACSIKIFSQKMENHVTIKRKRPAGKSDANPVSMIIGYKFKGDE